MQNIFCLSVSASACFLKLLEKSAHKFLISRINGIVLIVTEHLIKACGKKENGARVSVTVVSKEHGVRVRSIFEEITQFGFRGYC